MLLISSIQTSPQKRLIFARVSSCLGSCEYPVLERSQTVSSKLTTAGPLPRVVIATITELAYIETDTTNPTYTLCEVTIFEVIIQCLSIVTACWGTAQPIPLGDAL